MISSGWPLLTISSSLRDSSIHKPLALFPLASLVSTLDSWTSSLRLIPMLSTYNPHQYHSIALTAPFVFILLRTLLLFANAYLSRFQPLPHSLQKHPGWTPRISERIIRAPLRRSLTTMKHSIKALSQSARCSHLTAGGRQCRLLAAGPHDNLCLHHRTLHQANQPADLSSELLSQSQGFQTAQGVNFALTNIYELLAADRISTRRAAVLAYINSLILRTLPAIDADLSAGITDPTLPEEPAINESPADSATTQPTVSLHESERGPEVTPAPITPATQHWDASIPEPDPTRKPS